MSIRDVWKSKSVFLKYCNAHCDTPSAMFNREDYFFLRELGGDAVPESEKACYPELIAIHRKSMDQLLEKVSARNVSDSDA